MEVHHKHGPLGNWREFAKEVGIIVLGVVIALGGEQVVEAVHHHFELRNLVQRRLEVPQFGIEAMDRFHHLLAAERNHAPRTIMPTSLANSHRVAQRPVPL